MLYKERVKSSRVKYFLNSQKDTFSDVKDLQIGGAGGRPSKGGRELLLKGSNTADDLCWFIVFLSADNLT